MAKKKSGDPAAIANLRFGEARARLEEILAEPYLANPLRKHDCPPITDGAAAMIIAAGENSRPNCPSGPARDSTSETAEAPVSDPAM